MHFYTMSPLILENIHISINHKGEKKAIICKQRYQYERKSRESVIVKCEKSHTESSEDGALAKSTEERESPLLPPTCYTHTMRQCRNHIPKCHFTLPD